MSTTTEDAGVSAVTQGWTVVDWLALVLAVVGALNWGLVGIGGFAGVELNLVNILLGWLPALENVVYIAVGLSGALLAYAVVRS